MVERSRRRGRACCIRSTSTARARSCESTHFQYSATETRWLVGMPVRRESGAAALGRRLRGGPTQQHLRREPGHEHVRGKRIVADLHGESEGRARVPKHLVQSLEHPDAARGDALVGDCERLAIALRLRHYLGEELVRLLRRLIESDTRQNHGGPGCPDRDPAGRSRHARCASARRESPTRNAGTPHPQPVAARLRGDQAASTRSPGRASERRTGELPCAALCGLFERVRHRLVRRADRRSQLPGARFGVVQQLCKPSVNLGPPSPVGRLVRPGREERMREADAALVEVDDPRRERGRRPVSPSIPDAASVTADRRMRAAAAHRKSRLCGGSARSRPWTRSCRDSGTGNGCPPSTETPLRRRLRTISRA